MPLLERCFANHFVNRVAHKAGFALVLLLSLLWSIWPARHAAATPEKAAPAAYQEWPSQWEGAPLRPLALGEVEQRFASQFPGAIARFTDGRRVLVLRHVEAPTRMLHPAADCYRALGYQIAQARLERDMHERLWRCFVAERQEGRKLKVCERIEGAGGDAFTDTSAWYWAAVAGRSTGPWQAVTLAQSIE